MVDGHAHVSISSEIYPTRPVHATTCQTSHRGPHVGKFPVFGGATVCAPRIDLVVRETPLLGWCYGEDGGKEDDCDAPS